MKLKYLSICMGILMLLNSCRKASGPGDGNNNYGTGAIFMRQGTEGIIKFNLSNGTLTNVLPNWFDAGWDISWDGSKGVKQVNKADRDTRYIIFDANNGSTIKEVRYTPSDDDGGLPYFSPDGSRLALEPTFDDGLVILDMNSNVLQSITGYGATHEFKSWDYICWEAGGTILFKKDGGLWRTSTDFSRAFKVRNIPFSDWQGEAAASPDGKKIAIPAGGHVWLMNADGSDFHVVTESTQDERNPCFSPDGKYITMGANPRALDVSIGGVVGNAYHLCIIPADGQVYKVRPGEDKRVTHPMVKGQPDPRGTGKAIVGSFIWR